MKNTLSSVQYRACSSQNQTCFSPAIQIKSLVTYPLIHSLISLGLKYWSPGRCQAPGRDAGMQALRRQIQTLPTALPSAEHINLAWLAQHWRTTLPRPSPSRVLWPPGKPKSWEWGSVAEEWAMQEAEKGWVQMPGKGESTWSRDHTTQGQELFWEQQ